MRTFASLMLPIALAIVGSAADEVAMSAGTMPPMEAGLLKGDGFDVNVPSGNLEIEVTQTADPDHPVGGMVPTMTNLVFKTDGQNKSSVWLYQNVPVDEFNSADEDTGCGCGMG